MKELTELKAVEEGIDTSGDDVRCASCASLIPRKEKKHKFILYTKFGSILVDFTVCETCYETYL